MISELFSNISLSDIISMISLVMVVIGGMFALNKWNKSIKEKRSGIVQELIEDVRGNTQISTIMDMVDWDEDFSYDGKFHVNSNPSRSNLKSVDDNTLFKMIDYTLSVFSYICYMKEKNIICKQDLLFFDYEIKRLFDNKHIANYLFSLYHWSKHLGVNISFKYLVNYGIKRKYLYKDFKNKNSLKYTCFLIF